MTPCVPFSSVNFRPLGISIASTSRLKLNSVFSCISQIVTALYDRRKCLPFCRGRRCRPTRSQRLPLQFLRLVQQLDHAFEQTRCAAAVDAAMIEAQRDLCFGFRNEFLFSVVP